MSCHDLFAAAAGRLAACCASTGQATWRACASVWVAADAGWAPCHDPLVVLPDACAFAEALQRPQDLHQHGSVQEGAALQQPLDLQGRTRTRQKHRVT